MPLPPPCTSTDMLLTVSGGRCVLASSLGSGSPSTVMPLPMWMRRSSRAISRPYHGLLRADGRKLLRVSPICYDSGSSRISSHLIVGLPARTEAAQWLVRYAQYLEHVCGTAPGTRTAYLRIATRLLTALFGAGRVQWHTVSAQALTDFVRQEVATKHGGGRKVPSVAVRSLLRFLVFRGELAPGLEAAVPIPRQWTHATLPGRLTVAEVERVLATCTDGSPAALRNHAILLLLARLGVRAHEVAALCLEDINWYAGQVRIHAGKTRHARVLPLVQEVGEAVAAYLQHGRPPTPSRHLFLHCRAPFRPLTDATAISRMAARALRRAGITASARLGAHTFRHTAASQMVNQGASFKDVADVLGHRSLQTTGIYAKLNIEALAEMALPWMGDTV